MQISPIRNAFSRSAMGARAWIIGKGAPHGMREILIERSGFIGRLSRSLKNLFRIDGSQPDRERQVLSRQRMVRIESNCGSRHVDHFY